MKSVYEINISRGIIVDPEHIPLLKRHLWHTAKRHKLVYAARWAHPEQTILLHREILGFPHNKSVDHINGNGLDNRISNLRVVTHAQNLLNRTRLNSNNTSGYRGVSWRKETQTWQMRIQVKGHPMIRGSFINKMEAVKAHQAALALVYKEIYK